MISRNYASLNPADSKTHQSTITFRTRRSRASSFSTLDPLPGCLPLETIRINRINTNYNRKKSKLLEVSKENVAMAMRITSQKSAYQSIVRAGDEWGCKKEGEKWGSKGGQKRRISICWSRENKQNLQQIDKILTARDKQIRLLSQGRNILE